MRPEIADWSDMRAHALAVDAPDTAFALVLRSILLAHGLDLAQGDYTFAPYGAPAARLESMLKSETFGAILNPPTDSQAVAQGMRAFGDQHEVLPNYPGGVVAVRRDWANANRGLLVHFLAAWRQAGDFSQDNRGAAARLFADDAGIPLGQAAGTLPAAFNSGRINLTGLQTALDLRNEFGYELPMGPNLAVYVDESFWNATEQSK